MTIIPLSMIEGFMYYMRGTILFMSDPYPIKPNHMCVPFGIYNADKDEIKLYKGWDEKINKLRSKIQRAKEGLRKESI